jgi:hypothetical protein
MFGTCFGLQKKEVLCNAVGKLCASITNALSKFMHEVSALEVTCVEITRDGTPAPALVENNDANNVEENARRDEEDVIPEDSSELPTQEDAEDTSADEDQSSVDGSSTDDYSESEDDPDWEQDELNSRKQKRAKPGDGAAKSEKGIGKGSGHDVSSRVVRVEERMEFGVGSKEQGQ